MGRPRPPRGDLVRRGRLDQPLHRPADLRARGRDRAGAPSSRAQRGWRPAGDLSSPSSVRWRARSPALFLACGAVAYAVAERQPAAASSSAVAALGAGRAARPRLPRGRQRALRLLQLPAGAADRDRRLPRDARGGEAAPLRRRRLRRGPRRRVPDRHARWAATRPGWARCCSARVLAFGLWRRQRLALVLLAPVLIYWQWSPVVRDLEEVHAQPSVKAELLRAGPRLPARRPPRAPAATGSRSCPQRTTGSPPTSRAGSTSPAAGSASSTASSTPSSTRTRGPLTAAEYRHWLDDLAVGYVAVPDTPLDYAGEAEARLIAQGPPLPELVFRSADWTVYRVNDPAPLAIGAGDLVKLTPGGLRGRRRAPGSVLVRVRWTPYWSIERGTGCVEESPGGVHALCR